MKLQSPTGYVSPLHPPPPRATPTTKRPQPPHSPPTPPRQAEQCQRGLSLTLARGFFRCDLFNFSTRPRARINTGRVFAGSDGRTLKKGASKEKPFRLPLRVFFTSRTWNHKESVDRMRIENIHATASGGRRCVCRSGARGVRLYNMLCE